MVNCIVCNKPVARKGSLRCRACYYTFLSIVKTGRNYPNCKLCGKQLSDYRGKSGLCKPCLYRTIREKKRCIDCGKLIDKNGRSKRCTACAHIGKLNGNYLVGISRKGYSYKFSNKLKILIRNKIGKCVICGITNVGHNKKYSTNLCIHHIDYNKQNSANTNLIPLCSSCHGKTNYSRDYWKNLFKGIIIKV